MVDPLEEDKGVDIVVHAQRVLGKVQSSKRDMELQSELEEAERAFGDFVQALGIVNEDGWVVYVYVCLSDWLQLLPIVFVYFTITEIVLFWEFKQL